MSRILVFGASGMLGHKLCQELPKFGHSVVGTLRAPDDQLAGILNGAELRSGVEATEPGAVEQAIVEVTPDVVINAIGIVKQPDESAARFLYATINTWLPHRLALACKTSGIRLIQMSTDAVFSGQNGPYTENDRSDARDLYGQSKYLGEPDVTDPLVLTIRSSIVGRELRARSHGLVEWFLAQKGKTIDGFTRSVFSGLTTIEMARVMALIVEEHPELSGVYNVAGEPISKFDLLALMSRVWNLDIEVRRQDGPACDRVLEATEFRRLTGYRPPSWPQMLARMQDDPTPYEEVRAVRCPGP